MPTNGTLTLQEHLIQVAQNLGGTALTEEFKQGIEEEQKVRDALDAAGIKWHKATEKEDRSEDIDLWAEIGLQRVPVSIKAQAAGVAYGNIYMELQAQLTKTGAWVPSWFEYGKATVYAIIQADVIRFYWKTDIQAHVEAHGWLRVRSLSKSRKATQGGSYVFQDARCGYLETEAVVPFMKLPVA